MHYLTHFNHRSANRTGLIGPMINTGKVVNEIHIFICQPSLFSFDGTVPYRAYFSRDLNFANDRKFRFVDLFFTNCYSLSVVTPM